MNSLPYHPPLVLADRIRQLDHQTMGRVMLGAGPGQLASDAFMMGIDPLRQRAMMADALDAVVRLLRGETVTARTDWFSPGGHGDGGRIDRLSIGLRAGGAARHRPALPRRRRPDGPRRAQRQLGRVREALTESEARTQAEYGVLHLARYIEGLSGTTMSWGRTAADAVAQWTGEGFPVFGVATIGTPADAIARIEALAEASGGFGTLLVLDLPTGTPEAKRRSYELFAEYVVPHFTGANRGRTASLEWARANSERFVGAMRQAVEAAVVRGGRG